MRQFTTICIDNLTNMVLALSECSYNAACDWLMRKGFTDYDSFESCHADNTVTMTFSKPYEKVFMYDENRGLLLTNRG